MSREIAGGRNLGVVDMRRIAPTVSSILKVDLPDVKAGKLDVAPRAH
jgi:hypothetical protein